MYVYIYHTLTHIFPLDSKSKKRFNNAPVTREVANDEAPAPPKPSRGRFGKRKYKQASYNAPTYLDNGKN